MPWLSARLDDSVEVSQLRNVIPLDGAGAGLLGSGQEPIAFQLLHDFGLNLRVLAHGKQRPRRCVAGGCTSQRAK